MIGWKKAFKRSAEPQTLKIHARAKPVPRGSDSSANNASVAAMRSPKAAECAKADGRSGDTARGTRKANAMNRKLCRMSSGRNASAGAGHGVAASIGR